MEQETFEKIKRIYEQADSRGREIMEQEFPELRESEDEKVIKALETFINQPEIAKKITFEARIEWLSWLEKQKEPEYGPYKKERETWVENTITDTFPKQDGDFISKEDYRNILRRTANHFYVMGEKQKEPKPNYCHYGGDPNVERCKHCSTVCSGRLAEEQKPRKFKLGDKVHWHDDDMNVVTITGFRDDAYLTDSAFGPILFCYEDYWEKIGQKPTEKQDYSGLNDLERAIHRGFLCAGVENVPVGIIKDTAKECIANFPWPTKWSKEDENTINELCNIIVSNSKNGYLGGYYAGDLVQKLKSLRPQPKQEWSKEDEKIISEACRSINEYAKSIKVLHFTKSLELLRLCEKLKDIGSPFKPSEEQMRILNWAANGMVDKCIAAPEMRAVLRDLYEQLKKL